MSVKYSRLPTNDPDSVALDFNSIYDYDSKGKTKYESPFEYGGSSKKYKSAFTYSNGYDPNRKIESIEMEEPSKICKMCASFMTVMCYIIFGLTFPMVAWFSLKKVQSYERLVIYRLGRLVGAKGPGIVIVLPFIDSSSKVDLRMKAFSIPPQKVLTTDGATIEVGGEVLYRVKDATLSVSNVQNLNKSTRVISETVLQKQLGKHELSDIKMNKESISFQLIEDINRMTLTWGVEVTRATISQVKVITEPNPNVLGGDNPLSFLGPLLFPTGSSNMPLNIDGSTPQMPANPSEISPSVFHLAKKQELEMLQKQYPHLKDELAQLAKVELQEEPEDPSGASGPAGNALRFQSPQDLLKAVVPKLNSDLVEEFRCIYKFVVTGPGGGTFYLDLKNHEGDADEGEPRLGKADVTLTLSMSDLDALLTGQASAFSAYMTGRIAVDGDMGMASKLSDIVELFK